MTPQELKNSILQLAIQGKLVEQRAEEGTGAELLEKIFAEKNAEGAKGKGEKSHAKSAKSAKVGSCVSREEIPDDEKPFEIPESWEWVRLESIVNSVPSKQYQILESEVRTSGKFAVISQSKEYSIGFTDISEKVYHHVNPVIVFGDHTTEVKYVEFDFVVGADGVKIFEPLDGLLLAKYLLYVLLFNTYDLSKVGGYSRHYKFLKNKPIPLPPLAEQKRIVAKIEELMPLVDRYEKAWSRLEDFNKRFPVDMQKSLLQMAIQGKLVEQRADEGTGAELLEKIFAAKNAEDAKGKGEKSHAKSAKFAKVGSRVSREEIPDDEKPFDIPESWEWYRIGDLFNIVNGFTPLKRNLEFWSNGDIPWFTIEDVRRQGRFIYSTEKFITQKALTKNTERVVPPDTVLLCCTASVGEYAYTKIPLTTNQQFNAFVVKKDYQNYIYPLYVFEYVKTLKNNLIDCAGKTTFNFVSVGKLSKMLIPLPPLAEQKRIVAKLEELLPLCERLR